MGDDLDQLMRKTKTYWYEDGLVEILGGLFFVAVGAWLLLERAAPPNAPYRWIFAPGLMVVVVVWLLGGRRAVDWLKQRITYPRTGYVAYRRQRSRSALARVVMAGVIGAAMGLAIAGSLLYRQDIVRVIPLIVGAGVAALLARIGGELALTRFYVEAVWSLGAGLFLAWLTAELALGIALYYLLLGAAVLIAGVITLLRYLRAAPPRGQP